MGLRAIKGPFARLKVKLLADAYSSYRIIVSCAHLNNFRTRFVGLNRLRSVYASERDSALAWAGTIRESH